MNVAFAYLLSLVIILFSYVFCIYTHVWYLDDATTLKIHLAFILPMAIGGSSLFVLPSRIFVGVFAVLAFVCPYLFSPFKPTIPIVSIEVILVGALVATTAFIERHRRRRKNG